MSAPSIARLHISRGQYLLAFLAVALLATLGVSTLRASNETIAASQVLSDIETPAASIIFTQRETLVYTTQLALWSNGGTTRREVQISRNLLEQRLSVIDSSKKSMGERASAKYWQALRAADQVVAQSPMGILPENLHSAVTVEILPIIDEIMASAREMVVSYQRSIDAQVLKNAERVAALNRLNLTLFSLFLAVGTLFLIWTIRSNFKLLRRTRKQISDEREALEKTIAELEDLNLSKSQFISTVNHELRTPLTSIIGYVEMARQDESVRGTKIDNYLAVVDRNAEILLGLVESALALSKIDSSSQRINFKRLSISEVVAESTFLLRPASEKAGISITYLPSESGEIWVDGDQGLLNHVMVNILANAIKFSPESTPIEITNWLSSDGERVEISIKDQGIGIPEEDIPQLFTRFYRAKNAISGHFQGSGLGLAITAQVIELHGGSINLESQVGVGTTITISLPVSAEPSDPFIRERRLSVLQRSLARLELCPDKDLKALTHEIGGAIGFYGYRIEGEGLLAFSRSLPIWQEGASSIDRSQLTAIISGLHQATERLESSDND